MEEFLHIIPRLSSPADFYTDYGRFFTDCEHVQSMFPDKRQGMEKGRYMNHPVLAQKMAISCLMIHE